MKKALIISCYFGTLPSTCMLWMESCSKNKDYDFLLVTDQPLKSCYKNVKVLTMEFSQLVNLVNQKVVKNCTIPKPYKLCDFKPAYGIIFSEFTKGYPFWGHCDIDMVMGDINAFITETVLKEHDKILYLGHLSLYRNTEEINQLCLPSGGLDIDWIKVYRSPEIFGVDEDQGIYTAMKQKNFSIFSKRIFFDIYPFSTHLILDNIVNRRMGKTLDKNYIKQLFLWHNGSVYRFYFHKGKLKIEDAIYIHMGKNKMKVVKGAQNYNTLIFSKGYIYRMNVTDISKIPVKKMIHKYNRLSIIQVFVDHVSFYFGKIVRKIRGLIQR